MSGTDPSFPNAQIPPRPDDTTGNSLNAATQTIPTTKTQRHLNPDIERLILEWRLYSLATQDTEASELALICRYFHAIVSTWRWRYVQWPRYVDTVRPASVKTTSEGWTMVCKILPLSVAPFVRNLYIACHLAKDLNWRDLLHLICHLSSLTTVTFDLVIPPPSYIISTLLSTPTLSSLQLISMPLNMEPPPIFHSSAASLQRLVLTRPVPWTSIDHCSPVLDPTLYLPHYHSRPANFKAKLRVCSESVDDEDEDTEEFVRSLLCPTPGPRESLSMRLLMHLELDLELVRFEVLGRQEFPRLERLVFRGMCPSGHSKGTGATRFEENPYDLTNLMNMPNLRELSFALIHPQPPESTSEDGDGASVPSAPPSFQVIHPIAIPLSPDSYHPHPDSEETIIRVRATLSTLFPNLEIFALSNPNPNDLIFHALPPSVHSVHLSSILFAFSSPLSPSHPLFRRVGPVTGGSRTAGEDGVPRIDSNGLRKIVAALRSHPERRLYAFRVMLSVEMRPELLECLAEAFSELRRLEIKRSFEDAPVRYSTRQMQMRGQNELDAFTELEYIAPLLPLTHLTHLRLPIFTPSLPVTQSATKPRPEASLASEKLAVMSMLSHLSPSIEVLGFYRQFSYPHVEEYGIRNMRTEDVPGWCDWVVTRDFDAEEDDDGQDQDDEMGRKRIGKRGRGEVREVRPVWPKSRQVPVKKTWLKMFDTRSLY